MLFVPRSLTALAPSWPRWSPPAAELRRIGRHYLEVFAGTAGRLALQAVYFLTLANALPLAEFGVFATAAALGIMLGAFSGFGFSFVAFRASVRRPQMLGRYFGVYLAASCLSLPIALLVATPVYFAVFAGSLSFAAFAMVVTAESFLARLIEGIHRINNGRGRFASAAIVNVMSAGLRAVAALGFVFAGFGALDNSLEVWIEIYFGANLLATMLALACFCPPIRLRRGLKLVAGHWRDAIMPALSAFVFDAQTEIDKLVIIVAAGQRAAGIYAISVRIIELACVPARTFYVIYSRKLIRERRLDNIIGRNLLIEAGVFATGVAGFAVFLFVLSFKPGLLGPNVEVARQLFGVALLVPALRSLVEYHSDLYFAYHKLGTEFLVATVLVALKGAALAILVSHYADPAMWGWWLNAIAAGIYLCSAAAVYRTLGTMRRKGGVPA